MQYLSLRNFLYGVATIVMILLLVGAGYVFWSVREIYRDLQTFKNVEATPKDVKETVGAEEPMMSVRPSAVQQSHDRTAKEAAAAGLPELTKERLKEMADAAIRKYTKKK